MTQDQLYLAITYFKKRIANGYENPKNEVDVQITPEGVKLSYVGVGGQSTYTAIVDETKGEFFKDFKVVHNYDNWGFAPEDND